jgi:hypothetical protein
VSHPPTGRALALLLLPLLASAQRPPGRSGDDAATTFVNINPSWSPDGSRLVFEGRQR